MKRAPPHSRVARSVLTVDVRMDRMCVQNSSLRGESAVRVTHLVTSTPLPTCDRTSPPDHAMYTIRCVFDDVMHVFLEVPLRARQPAQRRLFVERWLWLPDALTNACHERLAL